MRAGAEAAAAAITAITSPPQPPANTPQGSSRAGGALVKRQARKPSSPLRVTVMARYLPRALQLNHTRERAQIFYKSVSFSSGLRAKSPPLQSDRCTHVLDTSPKSITSWAWDRSP